ncbi:MAG: acetyl-CoA carboxylase carboxyltransferase subunit alpha [Gemmatimonadetes bacterium]|nr:acetyl-CoA carboxylase carboxyltransferase subunit alpha [Gemmatimonadota bacterium]NIO31255.1 acetyl-CoA carboxylase carboxyltransferase subunit alpha [Gemmatimonadota bacterium]
MASHQDFERSIGDVVARIGQLKELASERGLDVEAELRKLEARLEELRAETLESLTPMERVQIARHQQRPHSLDMIERVFTDFVELHGDRAFRDDPAVVCGWARLDGRSLMVIAQQKGRNTKENLKRNFAMMHPEGYRKALRMMRMAEKFGRPVITIIDTPAAYPGIGAEERGQAEAIARNLLEMSLIEVPIVAAVIGEGGSGGALGLSVADRIAMLEYAIYSVISPEGCASILWKENTEEARSKAASALKLTAPDLLELGVIDEVIGEPPGGAHEDWDATATALKESLTRNLAELDKRSVADLLDGRYAKYREMGAWDGD